MGGLARRVSYTKLFREKLSGIPALLVDAGNYLTDERGYHGELRPDAAVKDKWVLQAYDLLQADVMNISSYELRYCSRLLRAQAGSPPARLISANIVAESSEFLSPRPFVVREIKTREGRVVRVALIGVTERNPEPPRGFRIDDPAEAAQRIVATASKQADIVVVLARVKPDEARRIAQQAPGIDVVIASGADSLIEFFQPPTTVGKTQLVFGCYETRMIGELRFYPQPAGGFSSRIRYITLDEVIPDEPAAQEFANRAKYAEEEAQTASKALLDKWLERSQAIGRVARKAKSEYAGSGSCAACHQGQYVKWSSGGHAHATDPLTKRPFEFGVDCLACHATRVAEDDLGFVPGVSCEQCHGPGASHASKPAGGYGRISNEQKLCSSCHASDKRFQLQPALTQIKH